MQKAWCYEELDNKKVRCNLCIHRCLIAQGKKGVCRTRQNRKGVLFNTVYGGLSSFSTDLVEKVPLYHFYPNQRFLTIGGVGCNLSCRFCLTWSITQKPPEEIEVERLSSKRLVEAARELGCRGIVYTHSEPTLNIEFYAEVMERAKKTGLVNVFATNGFISTEAFLKIANLLDAVALTFKGDSGFYKEVCGVNYDGAHFNRLVKLIKESGVHLEIIYVLIPGENDDEGSLKAVIELAKKADSPLIFLRFFPSYEMEDLESPSEELLEKAVNTAYAMGLKYAYMENIFEHPAKNTYCPSCKKRLLVREGYGIVEWNLLDKRCPDCGTAIPVIGEVLLLSSAVR